MCRPGSWCPGDRRLHTRGESEGAAVSPGGAGVLQSLQNDIGAVGSTAVCVTSHSTPPCQACLQVGPHDVVHGGLQVGLLGSVMVSQTLPLVQPVPSGRQPCGEARAGREFCCGVCVCFVKEGGTTCTACRECQGAVRMVQRCRGTRWCSDAGVCLASWAG